MRPTDRRDIPYMQPIDVIIIDLNEERYWDNCILCGKYRFINHAVAFYEEPVHQEIGSLMPNGDEVGGMSCCKECHDNHYQIGASNESRTSR